jgi:hypothetical protein
VLAGEEPSRRHDDLIPKMPAIWPPSPGYAGNAFLSGSAVVRNAFGPAIHAEVAQWLLGVGSAHCRLAGSVPQKSVTASQR